MKNAKNFLTGTLTFVSLTVSAQSPKNVLFILADDLGWCDVTLYGHTKFYETPNLERLAKRGMLFTNAYSASPLSSPTRASILTGQTPARHGITTPGCHLKKELLKPVVAKSAAPSSRSVDLTSATRLRTDLPTLGKMFKEAGYQTAHFGKWHLGPEPYSPLQHGFDVDIPHWPGPGPAGSFVAPWKYPNFKENKPKEHIEDRMTDEAIKWLRNRDKTKPFFMDYWQFSVHAPFNAKEEYIEQFRHKIDMDDPQHSPTYAAMVKSMDDAVGRLMDELDRQGIADETIIVFFSDNGGNMYNFIKEKDADGNTFTARPTSNYPLRGGKGTLYEGGIHVPCVVVWPGLTAEGSKSDVRVQATDFYPTLLNGLKIDLPKDYPIDGEDFRLALEGKSYQRSPMFTYFPNRTKVPEWLPGCVSVHVEDWKLIRIFHNGENGEHAYCLFNLAQDISETNNLASFYPEKVRELDKLIEDYLIKADAVVPAVNPKFNINEYKPEYNGVQGGIPKKTITDGTK